MLTEISMFKEYERKLSFLPILISLYYMLLPDSKYVYNCFYFLPGSHAKHVFQTSLKFRYIHFTFYRYIPDIHSYVI